MQFAMTQEIGNRDMAAKAMGVAKAISEKLVTNP
jgi:hypothetical protein